MVKRAATATTTAAVVLSSRTRVVSIVHTKVVNCENRPGSVSGEPARSAKPRNSSRKAAAAQTAAADAAYRTASERRLVVVRSGTTNAAMSSRPTTALEAMVATVDAIGTPHRTRGPASESASGASAPVIAAATATPTTPEAIVRPTGRPSRGVVGVVIPPA